MKKVSRCLHVIENRPLSPDVFVLTLGSEQPLPEILPGQFASILIDGIFLRRPFSIHDVDFSHNFIKFYIQKVGKGTEQLSKFKHGDFVDVLFPLGNGFEIRGTRYEVRGASPVAESIANDTPRTPHREQSEPAPRTLLVGGGCGIAPLLYLAKILNQQLDIRPTILIGGRSKKNILCVEDFVKYGNVLIMTDDGSMGDKGLVTEHPIFHKETFDQIYCCGPEPMMKAVGKLAMDKNIPCQVSLENMMACGVGACLCCVTKTIDGHQCVCTEGPVFNAQDLVW